MDLWLVLPRGQPQVSSIMFIWVSPITKNKQTTKKGQFLCHFFVWVCHLPAHCLWNPWVAFLLEFGRKHVLNLCLGLQSGERIKQSCLHKSVSPWIRWSVAVVGSEKWLTVLILSNTALDWRKYKCTPTLGLFCLVLLSRMHRKLMFTHSCLCLVHFMEKVTALTEALCPVELEWLIHPGLPRTVPILTPKVLTQETL